jgi:hypothetical protein
MLTIADANLDMAPELQATAEQKRIASSTSDDGQVQPSDRLALQDKISKGPGMMSKEDWKAMAKQLVL